MGFKIKRGFSYAGFHPFVAVTTTIQPSVKDGRISEGQADTNFGLDTFMFLRDYSGALKNARMLVNFDISSLPAGAKVSLAQMQLYNYGGQAADEGKVTWAYKLSRQDWTNLGVTWNSYKVGSAWTNPGGDYVTTNPSGASLTLPDTVGGAGWLTWEITDIVKDAVLNSIGVHVLIKLESEPETDPLKAPLFYTCKYTVDTTLRPKLVVSYKA